MSKFSALIVFLIPSGSYLLIEVAPEPSTQLTWNWHSRLEASCYSEQFSLFRVSGRKLRRPVRERKTSAALIAVRWVAC